MEKHHYLYFIVALFFLSACSSQSKEKVVQQDFEQERMERIKVDFNKTEEDVLEYIRKYIPDVTETQMRQWESDKSLECMMIDGKRMYFRNAAPNLFRVNKQAHTIKVAKDGEKPEGSVVVNSKHLPEVVANAKEQGGRYVNPETIKVKYTLTVNPNVVPEGKQIRCWLPYPRTDQPRQKNVVLLNTSEDKYVVAPVSCKHSTIYMEKTAVKNEPTVFSAEYEYTSYAEWLGLKPEDIKPYHTNDSLYKKYTSERETHIIFTPEIKALAKRLVGDETNPYLKVRKIFEWIDAEFPWASAREYSTIKNIPMYVLENKHGDCGQVSLLFITLARYCGIPAKFQSGFMMHPGAVNLHDWAQIYFEGVGWVPVDQSFGIFPYAQNEDEKYFFTNGIDAYRMIVNDDYSGELYPPKKYPRSETVDFQRGEVEWEGGNLYFPQWDWNLDVTYN